ncbi:MAG: hypothetical protein M3R43_07250 [Acidobacteriota bacterium]|nr:hypothetical protein [Acidobacteriota bacterium]
MISISNLQTAEEVNQAVQEAWSHLDRSAFIVREQCSEAEAAEYVKKIGDVLYLIVFKIQEPLYRQHPSLQPADWSDEWDDKPLLDPD